MVTARGTLAVALALAALAACERLTTSSAQDAAPTTQDAGSDGRNWDPDVHVPPPADPLPEWTPGTCDTAARWHAEARAVTSAMLLDESPPRLGVTEHLLVEVELTTSCDLLAGVSFSPINAAADPYELRGRAWTQDPPCAPLESSASAVLSIPARQQKGLAVVIQDADSLSELLTYEREDCAGGPDCPCDNGSGTGAVGDECSTDCSCGTEYPRRLSCVGRAGPTWQCVRPCSALAVCGDGETCRPTTADYAFPACAPGGDQCRLHEDCAAGFACELGASGWNRCVDKRSDHASQAGACACDAECPPGFNCLALGRCQIRCNGQAECPDWGGLNYCLVGSGTYPDEVAGVCGPYE